jgi:hypothetical protein
MKISKSKLKQLINESILSETQKSVGLPQDMSLENFQADNAIIKKAREIYKQYGQIGPDGQKYDHWGNLPPGGDLVFNILKNRIIQLGKLMNPSVRGYNVIQHRIAVHRQRRLEKALKLFGGHNRWYGPHNSVYSNDKSAEEYDMDWLIEYQETMAGGGPYVDYIK